MAGLFTSDSDLEESIFKKAVTAKKPTFFQGIIGTGDYNKYITFVKNQQKKQFAREKEEFNKRYDLEEQKLDIQISNQRKTLDKKYGVDVLRQEARRISGTQERIAMKKRIEAAEKQVNVELRHLNDQMKQLKDRRKKEEIAIRFRNKKLLEQADKEARQRLDEARKR